MLFLDVLSAHAGSIESDDLRTECVDMMDGQGWPGFVAAMRCFHTFAELYPGADVGVFLPQNPSLKAAIVRHIQLVSGVRPVHTALDLTCEPFSVTLYFLFWSSFVSQSFSLLAPH